MIAPKGRRRDDAPWQPGVSPIGHASVNGEITAIGCIPRPVFDILPVEDDRPRPWLANRKGLHPCTRSCLPNTALSCEAPCEAPPRQLQRFVRRRADLGSTFGQMRSRTLHTA